MSRAALIAVALSLAACAGEDDPVPRDYPPVEFTIQGEELACPGAQQWETVIAGAPYRAQWCVWHCVAYEGVSWEEVVIAFRLNDGAPAWEIVAADGRDYEGWSCPEP